MSLSTAKPLRARIKPRTLAMIAVGLLVLLVGGCVLFGKKKETEPYRTAAVEQGDITRSVSASGTLEALVTVTVGSQLSGQVKQVLVDFNDQVKRGQLMAVLDPSTYESRVAQAQADVGAQSAVVNQQRANLTEAQASLATQQAAYNRTKTLYDKGFQSKAALDTAQATLAQAQAAVATARAGINAQSARVSQSSASLASNRVDLARTRIIAPIDGVVVDRQVEPGQTVAASLSAPVLFVIAQDLSRVQAKILVDEADIGSVREGLPVRFTVDAFPDDRFTGVVTQVRKQPQTEQNVVAYVVLAEAANPQGKLLPGMTANADIVLEELKGVTKVPSAALRFTPSDPKAKPAAGGSPFGPQGGGRQGGGRGQGGGRDNTRMLDDLKLDADQKAKAEAILTEERAKARAAAGAGASGGNGERRGAMRDATNRAFDRIKPLLSPEQQTLLEVVRSRVASGGKRGVVWRLVDGKPQAVNVRIGATDGTQAVNVRIGATDGSSTQIFSRDLKVGDEVIVGGGPRAKAQVGAPGGRGGPGGGGGGGSLRRF